MSRAVRSGPSRGSRGALAALAWGAWLLAGALALDLPRLLRRGGSLLRAFEAVSPRVKAYVGIWVLGSVVLCAVLLRAVLAARGDPPPSARE